jgi:hypothetical protein
VVSILFRRAHVTNCFFEMLLIDANRSVQRIREAGIVMTAAAQRWVDAMPENLRRWNPAQTDDGGVVGASAI